MLSQLVWFAGAYTVQTNTVAVNSGRQVPFSPAGCECTELDISTLAFNFF